LAHFISFDGETDYANSPESNFLTDTDGKNATPIPSETFANNAGPFGYIEGWGNNTFNNKAYEQYQWMKADLAAVNRTKTPWIIASSHRPMYSTAVASYQKAMRNAFEGLFLEYGVDLYVSGHVHWYERMFPIGNGTIDHSSIVNNSTYRTNPGVSVTHIVNGMAGNIETHSKLHICYLFVKCQRANPSSSSRAWQVAHSELHQRVEQQAIWVQQVDCAQRNCFEHGVHPGSQGGGRRCLRLAQEVNAIISPAVHVLRFAEICCNKVNNVHTVM